MNHSIPEFYPSFPNLLMTTNVWIVMKCDTGLLQVEGVKNVKPVRVYFKKDKADASLRHNEWVEGPIPLDEENSKDSYPKFPQPKLPRGPKFIEPMIKLPKEPKPLNNMSLFKSRDDPFKDLFDKES